jgi:hypothetical protein
MARFEEIVDLYFTKEGDFFLSENGDLQDTIDETYRAFIQKVLTRMMSKQGDWALQPTVGADLTSFVGKPNTREVAQRMTDRIFAELQQQNLVRGGELKVEVMPLTNTTVAIALIVSPPRSRGQVILTFTYDMRENKLIPRNV